MANTETEFVYPEARCITNDGIRSLCGKTLPDVDNLPSDYFKVFKTLPVCPTCEDRDY